MKSQDLKSIKILILFILFLRRKGMKGGIWREKKGKKGRIKNTIISAQLQHGSDKKKL